MVTDVGRLKDSLRVELLTRRAERSPEQNREAAQALALHASSWPALTTARRVACYLSTDTEPPTGDLIDLIESRGIEVLLPVTGPGHTLDWAVHDGRTAEGPWGLREPAGPRLGPDALASCQVAFLPGLAVDHAGHRLGRGGGYYDRALATFTGVRCAVVFTEELLATVPHEPHDVEVDAALTPGGVFRVL